MKKGPNQKLLVESTVQACKVDSTQNTIKPTNNQI